MASQASRERSGGQSGAADEVAGSSLSSTSHPAPSNYPSSTSQPTPPDHPSFARSDTVPSTSSVDSQTVLLHDTHSRSAGLHAASSTGASMNLNSSNDTASTNGTASSALPTSNANDTAPSAHPPLQRSSTNNEPRKCWICFADETEDTPTSTAWKSPCPCALTAHESCILDWVADLEAPPRGQRTPRKIECPQCKGEIRIARPRSPIAEGVRRIDRILARLTVPGIALTLVGSLTAGAWVHGLMSIYVVFGPEDFATLFRMHRRAGPRLGSALAAGLVPMGLVLSKTSIADSVLPVIPVLFFATQYVERPRNGVLWPPSPSTAFVSLPYLKGLYDLTWHHLFAAKERQWIREVNPRAEPSSIRLEWTVRPRQGDAQGGGAGAGGGGAGRGNGRDNGQPAPAAAANARAHADADEEDEIAIELEPGIEVEVLPVDNDNGGANRNAAPNANGNNAQANNNGGGALDNANQLIDTGGRIADAVMGALCFPFVAAAAGELLRLALPPRYVFATGGSGAPMTGILQARWGRSIVGGCLYVVMKDTLRLYARYRLAMAQRQRHVLDYTGLEGKGRRRERARGS